MKQSLICLVALLITYSINSQTRILPFGSSWKYLDNGSDQGSAWRNSDFYDGLWKSGNGELGYGDGDEATIVSYGANAKNKFITTYFRRVISVTNPNVYLNFILELIRDDGAVVYVNGMEVFRSNMPTGEIFFTTKASSTASETGNKVLQVNIANNVFQMGENLIAVEIHQQDVASSDISFDLQLSGNLPPIANAGLDINITLPVNSATLDGSGSKDQDGTIKSFLWKKFLAHHP